MITAQTQTEAKQTGAKARVNWVDLVKGVTIILVVQMHITYGIEAALSQQSTIMHDLVNFFRAFRMPLFFLVAGLFLHRSINKPWLEYLDKKVLHFAYFYVLWILVTFAIKYPLSGGQGFTIEQLVWSVIEPFGTLWFIYLLAVFFIVTRLLKFLPMPVMMALGLGLFLWQPNPEISWLPDGHSTLVHEFGWRYIFFLSGFYGYSVLFRLADIARKKPLVTFAAFGTFVMGNLDFLSYKFADNHPVTLLNSYAGALSTIGICAVLAQYNMDRFLKFIGKHSLYIYISFFVPNAFLRTGMIKLDMVPEINVFILIVLVVSIATPILIFQLLKKTPLKFFFIRPESVGLNYKNVPPIQRLVNLQKKKEASIASYS